ncbi:50S ribosomal protein L3 [Candidatus Vidania fulgoroideorum]
MTIKIYKKTMFNIFYKGKCKSITIFCYKIKFNFNMFLNFTLLSKSKGKGFCGTVKRYNFSLNNKSHGNSKSYRKPGSIGMCQDPGRVFKGKKMAGRMGNNNSKIKNKKIFYFDNHKIFINGCVPGSFNSKVNLILNDNKKYKS